MLAKATLSWGEPSGLLPSGQLGLHPLQPINGLIPFVYGHHVHNVSGTGLAVFAASIYSDLPGGVAVPIVELVAHAFLVLSLCVVLMRIAFHKRTRKLMIVDSWEPLQTTDVAVRVFTVVAALALIASMLALVLMLIPMPHDGVFVSCVYACKPRSILHAPSH